MNCPLCQLEYSKCTHDYGDLIAAIRDLTKGRDEAWAAAEHARVQLAGCGVARAGVK